MKPAGAHVTAHTEEEILMILTESARGGPPHGGQWAVVNIRIA